MKRKQLKRIRITALVLAAVMLIVTAAFCLGNLITHDAEVHRQEAIFNELAEAAEETPIVESASDGEEETLSNFESLLGKNSDMVGWISVAGTGINYPVMQTKNSPNYYLKRNFNKEYSDLGVPYVQENCDLATSDNIIIYGHHIKGGKMFGSLDKFTSKSFYEKHKVIQFNTLTEQSQYQIIAVFKTVAYSASGFRYYDFVNADDEADFNAYVSRCKELALYDTGVTAKYGDRLLTLSTCKRFAENGRLGRRKGRKYAAKKHEGRIYQNTAAGAERWEFSTERRDRIRRGRSRREGEDVRRRRRADREARRTHRRSEYVAKRR